MSLADGAQTAVAEYFTNTGSFPASNSVAGLATDTSITGTYVASVDASNGLIKITYGSGTPTNTAIQSKILAISAVTSSGSIKWICGQTATTTVPKQYLPTSCQG